MPALDLLRRLPAAAWAASSRPVQMQDVITALLSVMQSLIDKSAGGADQAGGPLPGCMRCAFADASITAILRDLRIFSTCRHNRSRLSFSC